MASDEPTIQRLRELVQDASRNNPRLISRLEKAAFLVLLRPVEVVENHSYRVGSEDGLRYYVVYNGYCECSDYLRHGPGHPCKHRLALAIYLRLRENHCNSFLNLDNALVELSMTGAP